MLECHVVYPGNLNVNKYLDSLIGDTSDRICRWQKGLPWMKNSSIKIKFNVNNYTDIFFLSEVNRTNLRLNVE